MREAFKFDCEPRYGVPTALLVDQSRNWILGGTSRGIFQMWDLRFRLQVRTWAHPLFSAINSLESFNGNEIKQGRGILAGIDGGQSEISAWDLETGDCRQAWCAIGTRNSLLDSSTEAIIDYEIGKIYKDGLVSVSDFEGMLSRQPSTKRRAGVHAIVQPREMNVMFSAGTDRKIRMWDLDNIESSRSDISESLESTHKYRLVLCINLIEFSIIEM